MFIKKLISNKQLLIIIVINYYANIKLSILQKTYNILNIKNKITKKIY